MNRARPILLSAPLAAALALAALAPLSLSAPTQAPTPTVPALGLPLEDGSVRFAVIGDSGRGDNGQYQTAKELVATHQAFPFTFVVMCGDNIYGGHSPSDYTAKFETPYKPLLDAGVKFYAALGNHDDPNASAYPPFNMGGERFYTFRASPGGLGKIISGGVRFFALDTNYLDKTELDWLERELRSSGSEWKIAFFHHPLYSSGKTHGSALETRAVLEPLFTKYGVNVVLAGHDHVYERIKPERGIYHWVVGSSGSLRKGDLRRTDMTAKGFDTDYAFMLVEIAGEELHFAALSRPGKLVDSGVVSRPQPSPIPTPVVTPSPSPVPTVSPKPSPKPSAKPKRKKGH